MKRKTGLWLIAAVIAIGCANITINVYFPAESVQKAADVIEDQVRGEVLEQPAAEPATPGPQSRAKGSWLDILCPPAYAQEADLNINTPEIQRITETRRGRFARIDELLTQGVLGEGNDGYLKERDIRSLPLRDVPAVRKLVNDENSDRQKLYAALASANNIPAESIGDIGKQFAVSIRERLRPGQFYQNDKGEWVPKEEKRQ